MNYNAHTRKLASALTGVEIHPPGGHQPHIRVMTPTSSSPSPPPPTTPTSGTSLPPPFQPLQRSTIYEAPSKRISTSSDLLAPPSSSPTGVIGHTYSNNGKSSERKISRSASVVSLVPVRNRDGDEVMKMMVNPNGRRAAQ